MLGSIQRGPRQARSRRAVRLALIALFLAVLGPWVSVGAHEIPLSVHVQAFLRPEGQRLHLLMRLPLVSIRDINFPLRDSVLLDVSKVDETLPNAYRTWVLPAIHVREDDRVLGEPVVRALRVSLPSDRSFGEFETALAHVQSAPLPPDTEVPLIEAWFDLWLEYPITSDRARFSIDPQFARFGLRVATTLRFQLPDSPERAFHFSGDPGLVRLDPRWHQAAWHFVREGFAHILDGIDHLLFLFCLVLPIRRLGQLILTVTAFTVAHSITLASAAMGWAPDALWFPPLVETAIAASIVYMALENIVFAARGDGAAAAPGLGHRWVVAFAFGLVHGFGFSFALQETLQFAGSHLVTSLVSFNVGVELGQILVLLILLPILALAFRYVISAKLGIIIASALVTHTAWHWMTERGATLGEYDWSLADPATLATVLRMLMVVVAVGGVYWIVRRKTKDESRKSKVESRKSEVEGKE